MTHLAYILWHVPAGDEYKENAKLIGVYSSPEAASAAVERLKDQPGFCDYREGFEVDAYEMDKDHWAEGFISWDEAYPPDKQMGAAE